MSEPRESSKSRGPQPQRTNLRTLREEPTSLLCDLRTVPPLTKANQKPDGKESVDISYKGQPPGIWSRIANTGEGNRRCEQNRSQEQNGYVRSGGCREAGSFPLVGWDGEKFMFPVHSYPITSLPGSVSCYPHDTGVSHGRQQRTVTNNYSTEFHHEIPTSRIKEQE